MKYIEEFRNPQMALKVSQAIKAEVDKEKMYHFMEFCGGHTHAIFRYGICDLLPKQIKMIHGPGCPVCVLPIEKVDVAIRLSQLEHVIFCTYGDLMRVPGSHRMSLLKAQAAGAKIEMIYSTQDALKIARENPSKEVIFFAIGFETTTPPTALALIQAREENLKNFSVYCNHVLTPAAITHLLELSRHSPQEVKLDGFIGPAHVSTIIGLSPYRQVVEKYRKPVVIAGFEPLDIIQALLMLVKQINEKRYEVENEYTRVVQPEGNLKAQRVVKEVFELRSSFGWRGLGQIPDSALKIRDDFSLWDAEKRFPILVDSVEDHRNCQCGSILQGLKTPRDCILFDRGCSPENPIGACMVSSEGACAAYYNYGRHK